MAIAPTHPITLESGITTDYDDIGRIKSQSTSDGENISYVYNDDGRVETVTNSSGTTTYSYDPIGNLRGIESPNGSSIRYKHDGFGRVIEIGEKATATSPEAITKYKYDAGGNLVRVIDPNQQETVMVYDAVSRLESRTLPNGVTTTYIYQDKTDWIESITHTAADGTVLSSLTYEREPGGEPTKITCEDGSYRTFVYDTSLRLEQESFYDAAKTLQETITYTYDADSKRLVHSDNTGDYTYTYGDSFQLESVANGTETESYSHDEDGRLESIPMMAKPST